MGKYEPLGAFLRDQHAPEVALTFSQIEKITGVKLPPKAQHHRAWWSNNPSNNVMTRVWLEAGYESARVDINARKLVFRRVGKASRSNEADTGCEKGRASSAVWRVEGRYVHSAGDRSHGAGRPRLGQGL